ncbi:hypothetical protein MSM1_05910 [Mycobacterium sp. SM1]|uniref:DUF2231 domain-containing protein n=1 Tax=Mycobacterium sp. SM1 TaxID=2816243 RepID=UPI001BD02411|nr:DUF2231 domain-containing protein [Mycobacterium sp. SM1]MBS4727901.1 hypothetical protein [Mycobacterium sp. SM1]
MSTLHGLPAHILLNHFIIVLAPLTALLVIICALWPAARRRLVWAVLALATVTLFLTPLTTSAGWWLQERVPQSPAVDAHTALGNTTIYFSAALMAAAVLLGLTHLYQERGHTVKPVVQLLITVLLLTAAIAVTIQVYRIGFSGARAVWGLPGPHNAPGTQHA